MNEPIKHHYIPRFILKNFNDINNKIWYWDNNKKYLSQRNTKSVFMNELMYKRDDVDSTEAFDIENNLAKFENEISELVSSKILNKNVVELNRSELEKLRIFMMLLSFRSDLRLKQYKSEKFTLSTRILLESYKNDEDYVQFWKKEIDELSLCRSHEDIEKCQNVDPIIKQDFLNLLQCYYMTIVDARGQDFILGDTYPTLEVFGLDANTNFHMHHIYPISPSRAIILNHSVFKQQVRDARDSFLSTFTNRSKIKNEMIKEPINKYKISRIEMTKEDLFIYKVPKIYNNDVVYLNTLILNEVRNGFIFRDYKRIIDSLQSYENYEEKEYNKNSYKQLLDKLMSMSDNK